MRLYLIRHAEPIYDPDSLTKHGHRQAEAVGRRLALRGIDHVYASSSTRAQMTAQPLCEILNKEMTVLDWCNENHAWDYFNIYCPEKGYNTWPFWVSETRKQFLSEEVRLLGRKWYTHEYFKDTRFAEGTEFIQKNADEFLETLGYRHNHDTNSYEQLYENNDKIALFAHQGFGLIFLSCIMDIPYPQFATHFDIVHTGMTAIEFENNNGIVVPKIYQFSGDGHLYNENLPTRM